MTEGVLSIPFGYVDESINIFRFPNELSLILTRALLPKQQTLDIYINEQINTLRKGVKNFQVGSRKEYSSKEGYEGERILCHCTKGKDLINNDLIVLAKGSSLVIFTFSKAGTFTAEETAVVQSIINDFTPNIQMDG